MNRTCELKVRTGRRRKNLTALETVLERCRVLYNAALQERRDAYKTLGKSPSYYDQCKSLTIIRGEQPEYADLDAIMTRMTVLDRVKKAYDGFFRRVKVGAAKVGYPRFKARGRFDTLIFGEWGWRLDGKKLHIRGVGWLLVTQLPHREGKPVGLRLVKKANGWYAQVVLEIAPPRVVVTAPANDVGIDVGLTTFATLSDGKTIEYPRFLKGSINELATAQRALSSKKRGSNRRAKAKQRVADIHARIANRRKNFIWQAVAWLLVHYDGFAIEDLNIQGMMRGRLARSIMDAAWGMFGRALTSKAEEAGLPVKRVDPRGTSQRCSSCGVVVKKTLADRVHICPACGLVMDRDLNASINIRDLGWRSASKDAENAALRAPHCLKWDLHS